MVEYNGIKLSRDEIVKALKQHSNNHYTCKDCPLLHVYNCTFNLAGLAYILIEEQKKN